ncbi:hypothetical protein ASPZODRAFT_1457496 [Penicilliopsis zonata CBS 506.65]|uniref:P-type Cu(+) transporter n=1 Tax=Penicilliopsis zonata CBS 506.65 TaxID=1073090 RepID=A0A1L9SQ25_9EURO|nr:hypothetical protein ASPZODRAFT_1457496 [Penicilliopsis zonata CBS 506.65]OJJ49335.1 hypothetical protein ASPZODRAFT_1457496 [Penicilliopsis zonata CBS 506.65]
MMSSSSSSAFPLPAPAGNQSRSAASTVTTTLKVDGMTCGACTSAVEGAFQGIEGAQDVSVSLVLGRVVVRHEPALLAPERIAGLIEDRGFDATVLETHASASNADKTGINENGGPRFSTTTLSIEGMTCGACTAAVEGGLTGVDGVRSVEISLLSERAMVEHDEAIITPKQIADIIEDRGFGAEVLETTRDTQGRRDLTSRSQPTVTTVSIDGMTCGACTSSVQNAFKDVDGLIQFNISLLAERAIIVHDPKVLEPKQIVTLIEDAGFDATVVSSQPQTIASTSVSNATLNLHGLRDASSATTLETSLRQKPGVLSASITMRTSKLTVSFDPSIIGIRHIVDAIEADGYNALLSEADDNNAQLESLAKTKEIQQWKRDFFFCFSFAIPVFVISMALPMCLPRFDFGQWKIFPGLYLGDLICLLLTIPVQFGIGKRFYVSSYKSLKHRSPTMDVLVMIGTSTAFFYSCFTMIVAILCQPHDRPSIVFDTSTMLITFITLGRWLENRAKGQTSAALSRLMSLTPSMTTIYEDPIAAEKLADDWEKQTESEGSIGQRLIPTELIEIGDIVILRPGDKVSADGIVIRGESYVDESMITGEALPIHKGKGSMVIAGTVNGAGTIDLKVTRAGKDTQLSQIVKLVQNAQTSRAPIQRMADVAAGYFVPAIISLGAITFFGWMVLSHALPHPPKIFMSESSGGKVMVCLKLCISVIVFACPCALGLSTPTAVMVGTGVGAEHGILVKGGAVLEAATKVNHIVFDKTGTLTSGKMSVADARLEPQWETNDWRRRLWWLIVGLAEMNSEHPVGRAIVTAAKNETGHAAEDALPGSLGDFEAHVGKGISAVVEPVSSAERVRYRVLVGNTTFLRSKDIPVPESADADSSQATTAEEGRASASSSKAIDSRAGLTVIHMAVDGQYAGSISLRDTVKTTAVAAVAALHRMGITTSLVTGDTYSTAVATAKAVGIPISAVHASASPSDKQAIVAALQEEGGYRVAMVGDGINDSPALVTASVGIALASGTDVAVEAADIVLMRPDDLLSVPASLSLSRSVFNRIKMNLVWACLYNVIGLPFAMGVFLPFGGFMLPPMAAGAAMAASSVSVVVSSLLLKFWNRPRWMTVEQLEKEAEMGIRRRKGSWWRNTTSAAGYNDQASSITTVIKGAAVTVLSWIPGRGSASARADDGYVPLQTVEPAV